MAISTYGVQLMYKKASGSTYEKLVDIKNFPDLGGTPETIDTTTLSDSMRTSVPGIIELDILAFECNYVKEDFDRCKALDNVETEYAIYLGNDKAGSDGKFYFKGKSVTFVTCGGVNEAVGMTVSIACTTEIRTEE
jgi:hypothetical protein